MKNLFILLSILFSLSVFQVQGQGECPPIAWCHPDGQGLGYPYTSFMDGMTAAADYLGNLFNGDACANANYAEQVYCYPAKWLADAIPCMYGKDTPQHTLCEEKGDKPDKEAPAEEQPEGQSYTSNPNFKPFYTNQKNAKQLTKAFLDKKKRGDLITKWDKGYSLKLKSKFYTNKKETEFVALMEMLNPNGKIIGRPILITKGNKVYVHDLIPKKK